MFEGAEAHSITLREAIDLALQNNLEARFERVGIRIAHSRVRFAAGAFDPEFTFNAAFQRQRRQQSLNDVDSDSTIRQQQAVSSNFALASAVSQQAASQQELAIAQVINANAVRGLQGLPPLAVPGRTDLGATPELINPGGISSTIFGSESFQMDAGLRGRTPWGLRYGFNVEANRSKNTFTGDTRDVIPEYQTFVGFTVVQPLLRNFGTVANLAELRLARVQKRSAALTWKEEVSGAVQSVMLAYFDMVAARQSMASRQEAIEAGSRLVANFQRRVDVGFSTPFDVSRTEASVSADRELLFQAKNLFLERQFALKRLILAEFDINDARVLIPAGPTNLPIPSLDRSNWLSLAFQNRYDYQRAQLEAEGQDIRLRYYRNQLLPQLDLVGTFGLNGLSDDYDSSFKEAFSGDTPTAQVGVNFSAPLFNLQARARYTESIGLKQQAILRVKQSELTAAVDVDTFLSRIETNRQRLQTARETRALEDQALKIALRRLEEGVISSTEVIDTQRRLYDAQSREFSFTSELNKAIAGLYLASATVLQRQGITFTDEPRGLRGPGAPKAGKRR